MPVLKSKPKFAADQLVRCFESFSSADGGCAQGTRLRGDNPIVVKWPQFFLPHDLPDDEVREARAEFWIDAGAEAPPPVN